MKRSLRILSVVASVLVIVYVFGPAPQRPNYTNALPLIPAEATELESYIRSRESRHRLKPDNEARIVWHNDSTRAKTPYALVYLHGFSASQEEGDPVHREIAAQFGCNLYLARLAEHGIDTTDQLINYTADGLWESAKEAYAIGRQLGEKVILMGTSTGGSNALHLASVFPDVAAVVLISPNIRINDPNAWLLNNHWGKQIATLVLGSSYRRASDDRPVYRQYWNYEYRIEALVQLQEYLETAMVKPVFQKVTQPVLTLAWYKSEAEQDPVVRVDAMRTMHQQLGTAESQKQFVEMKTTGDHVQGSPIKSKDVAGVRAAIAAFLKETAGIPLP
jgi:esterase/lipase